LRARTELLACARTDPSTPPRRCRRQSWERLSYADVGPRREAQVHVVFNGRQCALRRTSAPVIEFDRITKRFPDGTLAVRELSLTIPSHQVTVLVGSSGSGKTTLLRMINRMVQPTSGHVRIDDEDV